MRDSSIKWSNRFLKAKQKDIDRLLLRIKRAWVFIAVIFPLCLCSLFYALVSMDKVKLQKVADAPIAWLIFIVHMIAFGIIVNILINMKNSLLREPITSSYDNLLKEIDHDIYHGSCSRFMACMFTAIIPSFILYFINLEFWRVIVSYILSVIVCYVIMPDEEFIQSVYLAQKEMFKNNTTL